MKIYIHCLFDSLFENLEIWVNPIKKVLFPSKKFWIERFCLLKKIDCHTNFLNNITEWWTQKSIMKKRMIKLFKADDRNKWMSQSITVRCKIKRNSPILSHSWKLLHVRQFVNHSWQVLNFTQKSESSCRPGQWARLVKIVIPTSLKQA